MHVDEERQREIYRCIDLVISLNLGLFLLGGWIIAKVEGLFLGGIAFATIQYLTLYVQSKEMWANDFLLVIVPAGLILGAVAAGVW